MTNENLTPTLISGVSCYEQDGTAYLRLEDVARGLGFTQTQNKNGVEYTSVRWERVEQYLAEFGFPHKWGKDSFIPENIFYRLAMKANNPVAEKFQALVADKIIPSVRKNGFYAVANLDQNLPPELALADQTLTAVKKIYQMQLSQGKRLDRLEATKNIDYAQQKEIKKAKSMNIVEMLGGKDSDAYKLMSKKVFSEFWNDYYDYFGINAYANTPAIRYEEALNYARAWKPCSNTSIEIQQTNGQTSLFAAAAAQKNTTTAGKFVKEV